MFLGRIHRAVDMIRRYVSMERRHPGRSRARSRCRLGPDRKNGPGDNVHLSGARFRRRRTRVRLPEPWRTTRDPGRTLLRRMASLHIGPRKPRSRPHVGVGAALSAISRRRFACKTVEARSLHLYHIVRLPFAVDGIRKSFRSGRRHDQSKSRVHPVPRRRQSPRGHAVMGHKTIRRHRGRPRRGARASTAGSDLREIAAPPSGISQPPDADHRDHLRRTR